MIYPLINFQRQFSTQSALPANAPATNQTYSNGLLTLPEYTYTPSEPITDSTRVGDAIKSYYTSMVDNYLPQIDQFAADNAGRMTAWSPSTFKSASDFGVSIARGDLRGGVQPRHYYNGEEWDYWQDTGYDDQTGRQYVNHYIKREPEFYGESPRYELAQTYRDADGMLRPLAAEGEELFVRAPVDFNTWSMALDTPYEYVSADNFRSESLQEASDRMFAYGGDHHQDAFGDTRDLENITKDNSGKWGGDAVNIPELAQYINDPAWVSKDDSGNITAIRAELLPYLFRESINEEFHAISRGMTRKSKGFLGTLFPMVVTAVIGGAFGVAGAVGSGLTAPVAAGGVASGMTGAILGGLGVPAGVGLSTGGLAAAGAISGGISSAINGGDIGQGILLGGAGGALGPTVSGGLDSLGVASGSLVNNAITGAVTGGVTSAIRDQDIGSGAIAGAVTGGLRSSGLSTGSQVIDGLVYGLVGSLIRSSLGGTQPEAQAQATAPGAAATQDTTESAAPVTRAVSVAPRVGGTINYTR